MLFHVTACIACYVSNKFVYSISLSTNSPDEGPLLEMSRKEYFYLFQIVASENPSLGVVFIFYLYIIFPIVSTLFSNENLFLASPFKLNHLT